MREPRPDPANGMIFQVVDIEAMGTVKDHGEPMWPWLQEALNRALTVGAIRLVKDDEAHRLGLVP